MSDDDDPFMTRHSKTSDTEETSQDSSTSSTSGASQTSGSNQSTQSTQSSGSNGSDKVPVSDRKHVSMYLLDDLASELSLRYSELNLEWKREHDDDLPKNEEFYPAMIRVVLDNPEALAEELGLDDD